MMHRTESRRTPNIRLSCLQDASLSQYDGCRAHRVWPTGSLGCLASLLEFDDAAGMADPKCPVMLMSELMGGPKAPFVSPMVRLCNAQCSQAKTLLSGHSRGVELTSQELRVKASCVCR